MSKVRELAEKLFDAEQGPNPMPHSPWSRRPQLSDLWPRYQGSHLARLVCRGERALDRRRTALAQSWPAVGAVRFLERDALNRGAVAVIGRNSRRGVGPRANGSGTMGADETGE